MIEHRRLEQPRLIIDERKKIIESSISNQSSSVVSGFSISSNGEVQKKIWSIKLPSPETCEINEVNALWVDSENDLIYAACDSNVYVYSLEDGTFIKKHSGHKDYIHSVHGQ